MAGNLEYFIPQHGRAKISLRVPESHSLYICPPACGRRVGLRSIKNGEFDRISFMYLKEADVVTGKYLKLIPQAVEELLEVLDPAPQAFLVYVNCIDDFLGTDETALLHSLQKAFPGQRFVICHINPVAADEKIPPGAAMQNQLYSLLDPADPQTMLTEHSVNLIGNYVIPDLAGELYELLRIWGIDTVRHLPNLQTFEEFQKMAAARANLVLMEMGRYAAQKMEERLGIPWLDLRISYSVQEVEEGYRKLAALLGKRPYAADGSALWEAYKEKAYAAIRHCADAAGDTPIVVDSSAVSRPFALAKALTGYGFTVCCVFLTHGGKDFDREERLWIEEHCPHTQIIRAGRYDQAAWNLPPDSILIGYDAAFSAGRQDYVDIRRDETLFGFHGICRLMEMITEVCARI